MTARLPGPPPSWLVLLLTCLFAACASLPRPVVLDRSLSTSKSTAMADVQQRAPQAFARAEQLRLKAEEALSNDKPVLSEALAEQALVAFERAALQARMVQVRQRLAETMLEVEQRTQQVAELAALQTRAAEATKQLELRLEIEKHALPRAAIEPGGGVRRATARVEAARSIAQSAQLLCVAAKLLAPENDSVGGVLREAEDLASGLQTLQPHEALAQAMDARMRCLTLLSEVRSKDRRLSSADPADALLSKLSPSLAELRPHRDDRGIVLTAYDIWSEAGELTRQGRELLDRIVPIARTNDLNMLVVVYRDGKQALPRAPNDFEQVLLSAGIDASVQVVAELPSLLEVSSGQARQVRTEFVLVTQ